MVSFKPVIFIVINNKTKKKEKLRIDPFDVADPDDIKPDPTDPTRTIWNDGENNYTLLNTSYSQFDKFINFGGI